MWQCQTLIGMLIHLLLLLANGQVAHNFFTAADNGSRADEAGAEYYPLRIYDITTLCPS